MKSITEQQTIVDAATKGPWKKSPKASGAVIAELEEVQPTRTGHSDVEYYGGYLIAESILAEKDIAFIADARTEYPDLLKWAAKAREILSQVWDCSDSAFDLKIRECLRELPK